MVETLRDIMRTREFWLVVTILLASLILNIFLIDPAFNGPDAESNFKFAVLGQDWNWWLDPTAFNNYQFPMFYGTFFAIATKFSSGSFVVVQALQIIMGLTLACYGWLLTRHMSRVIRVLTLSVIAFSPSVLGLVRMNGYEILLSFLMTTAVVLLWGKGGVPTTTSVSKGMFILSIAGISFGFAMLTQGKVIVLFPILIWLAWKWGRRQSLMFIAMSAIPVVIWSIRNHFVLNKWNPFNSSSDIVMWMGNNPYTKTGEYLVNPPMPPGGESLYGASLRFIIEQPEMAFTLLLRRMVRLVEPTYIYLTPNEPSPFQSALHVLFMVTASIGLIIFLAYLFGRLWIRPPLIPTVGALAAIVVVFFLVHTPFATETRHLKPVVPIALTVIIPTLIYLIQRFKMNRWSVRSPQR